MKKSVMLLVAMILSLSFLCTAHAATIDTSVLTAESWVNPSGSTLTFDSNNKGKLVGNTGYITDFDYEVSGDSVTYSYKFWGDFTTGATFVYGESDGIPFLCLNQAGDLTSAAYYPASKIDTVRQMAEEKMETFEIPFGEEIDLGFINFTVDTLQNTLAIESASKQGVSYRASDGMIYVTVSGNAKNTGKRELNVANLSCALTLSNGNSYVGTATVDCQNNLNSTFPPAQNGTLILYFAVPEEDAKNYATADILLAMKDELAANVSFPGFGDFVFTLHADEAMAATAQQEPVRDKVYIEESPALPSPESYGDCFKSGSSVSSSNGKVSKIKYSYSSYDSSKAAELMQAYKEGLIADGYTVSGSDVNFTVSIANTKLAEVSLDSGSIKMDIVPGNDKLKPN